MGALLSLQDSFKRRGIRLNAEVIRHSRILRGWSQFDLAAKAGVAERTVRNAERGAPVKAYVAEFVAGALEIAVADIVVDECKPAPRKGGYEIAAQFQSAITRAILDHEFVHLFSLAHPEVKVRCEATSPAPFCREFKGLIGLQDYTAHIKRLFEARGIVEHASTVERIDGDGTLIFVRGKHSLMGVKGTTDLIWYAHFYRIEDHRVHVFEHLLGL